MPTGYETLCTIWFQLYNLENMKNTHEGVILLVKLQAEATLFIFKYNKIGFLFIRVL